MGQKNGQKFSREPSFKSNNYRAVEDNGAEIFVCVNIAYQKSFYRILRIKNSKAFLTTKGTVFCCGDPSLEIDFFVLFCIIFFFSFLWQSLLQCISMPCKKSYFFIECVFKKKNWLTRKKTLKEQKRFVRTFFIFFFFAKAAKMPSHHRADPPAQRHQLMRMKKNSLSQKPTHVKELKICILLLSLWPCSWFIRVW